MRVSVADLRQALECVPDDGELWISMRCDGTEDDPRVLECAGPLAGVGVRWEVFGDRSGGWGTVCLFVDVETLNEERRPGVGPFLMLAGVNVWGEGAVNAHDDREPGEEESSE